MVESYPCQVCAAPWVPLRVWSHLSPAELAAAKAAGFKRGAGRDLCCNCYQRARLAGEIDRYAPHAHGDADSPARCCRCGQPDPGSDLCRDCRDVTYDLNERDTWEDR